MQYEFALLVISVLSGAVLAGIGYYIHELKTEFKSFERNVEIRLDNISNNFMEFKGKINETLRIAMSLDGRARTDIEQLREEIGHMDNKILRIKREIETMIEEEKETYTDLGRLVSEYKLRKKKA